MKKLLPILTVCLLTAAVCLSASCKGGGDPQESGTETAASDVGTEIPDTEPDDSRPAEGQSETVEGTDPAAESESEPEAQAPVLDAWLSMTADSMTVRTDGDGSLVLHLTAVPGAETYPYTLSAALSADEAGTQVLDTQTPAAGESVTITFPYRADWQSDLLYIAVTAVPSEAGSADGAVPVTLSLRVKDGLPQLTPDGVALVAAAMTADEKAHLVSGVSDPVKAGASGGTYAIPRLGVPSMTVNDGPAGVRYGTATWYPSIANISSSWDTGLIARVGQSIGQEALALGIDVVLGPGMNIQKNVLGGRNFEYASEDPLLTGLAMSAYINGMQSVGTGACIKHFAANNQETARGIVSANVTERALREIYLKGFGLAVRYAQPWTVMSSYNCLNGLHTSVNGDLLTGILRTEWGYDGMVMTDWGATGSMADKVNAQNDINMPGNAADPQDILNALSSGKVTDAQLTLCCRNILGAVAKSAIYNDLHTGSVDRREGQTVSRETGPDTVVLLQNGQDTLPYREGTTLALFGNGINASVYGGTGSGSVNATKTVNILTGLKSCSSLNIYDANGNPFHNAPAHDPQNPDSDIEVTEAYAKACAANADAAVIVISRNTTEGADHSTLRGDWLLSLREEVMIETVSAAFHARGKTVTVVLNTGDPIEVVSWRDSVDSILWLGYPGQEAGHVLASVLTGEVNPNAKLTMTWPTTVASTPAAAYFPGNASDAVYYEDIYVGYRYYTTFDVPAAYDFGYGLSYTAFRYDGFAALRNADGTVTLTVTVTNTGSTAGREIVEFYVSKPETTQEQAARELCGFAKTALLAPGASETVTVTVITEALMTYVTDGSRWVIDKGQYTFMAAASVTDIRASAEVTVTDTAVVQDVENRCEPDSEFDYIRKADYKLPDPAETPENLALGKKAWADYCENDTLGAANAVDGDYVTRWSGLGTPNANHTWQVDLGEVYEIGKIDIRWESISAPFTVWISTDGTQFEKLMTVPVDGTGQNTLNLGGRGARVIRLTIPKGGYVSVFEFAAYEATEEDRQQGPGEPARENIAKGKSAAADNVQDAYVPHYAVDGNPETRWAAVNTGAASWQVDLGDVYLIDGLTLYLESAWVPYRVEYSTDGVSYQVLAKGKTDQLTLAVDNVSVEARYVRVSREGENWFSIYECEVYGKKK